MSLYGAMFSGVSGVLSESQNMAIISDNISNVNTVGYKAGHSIFSTLVTQAPTSTSYSSGGVSATPFFNIARQGLLNSSSSSTDIGISGNGMFVVNSQATGISSPSSEFLFTRAGNFTIDKNGLLLNAAGYYLQGYQLDNTGSIPATSPTDSVNSLSTVNISGASSIATPTGDVNIGANLPASQTTGTVVSNITIYDTLGSSHTMTLTWTRGAVTANTWTVLPTVSGGVVTAPAAAVTVDFGTDGTLSQVGTVTALGAAGFTAMTFDFSATGASSAQAIDLNLGTIGQSTGMTGFASAYAVSFFNQDGSAPSGVSSLTIDDNGIVTANFKNGTNRALYQLAVATFPNTNGLELRDGNAYKNTEISGGALLQPPQRGNAGAISPASLEASTVDLTEEFALMIITQRAYSAATKSITTADEMLQEIINIKR